MQNTAQICDGVLVDRVGTVDKRIEIVASTPVSFNSWITLATLDKIIPFLWICEAVLQKSLNQLGNICSCLLGPHDHSSNERAFDETG